MSRNGCKKIIVVNGHGGNGSLLPYFAQSQLEAPRDYVLYVQGLARSGPGEPAHKSNQATDMHAGESETSMSMVARPDLVHLERASQETGGDQARLKLPNGLYAGIWWYARFPNHYAGDGAVASRELGEFEMKTWINAIVQAIRAVKVDQESLRLQNQFYERSKHPLDPALSPDLRWQPVVSWRRPHESAARALGNSGVWLHRPACRNRQTGTALGSVQRDQAFLDRLC